MVLNSLIDLHDLTDITPHSLKNKLKVGEISDDSVSNLENFVRDVCQATEGVDTKEGALLRLENFKDRFHEIQQGIAKEIPDKNGNMRFIPEEYVEAIYILTYYMTKHFGTTQKDISNVLGFPEKNYKDRWGISPAVDFTNQAVTYCYRLLIDDRKDFLEVMIPIIGRMSSQISSSYFLCLSNDLSIIANIENNNKKSKSDGFNSMTMLYNITDDADIYRWVFYENLAKNVKEIKEKITNFIDVKDKEMTEEVFINMLKWGIDIKEENLRYSSYQNFKLNYDSFQDCISKRDWFIEARDDESYDYTDMFTVTYAEHKKGIEIDKKQLCDENIKELNTKIAEYLQSFVKVVDFSTLDISEVPFMQYVFDKYDDYLYKHPTEDIFLDTETFCMKYFIHSYFNKNGVSKDTYDAFKSYITSFQIRDYVLRYINADCKVYRDGQDLYSNRVIADELADLKASLYSGKERRVIRNALIYIDLDTFSFSDQELEEMFLLDEQFYFILVSSKKRNVTLDESTQVVGSTKYYIYKSQRSV